MKGGENLKALFFSGISCICFLICGFLFSDTNITSLKGNDTTSYQENKKSNQAQSIENNTKELKYKKLETKSIEKALEERTMLTDSSYNIEPDNQDVFLPVANENTSVNDTLILANEEIENVPEDVKENATQTISNEENIEQIKQTVSSLSKSLENASSIEEVKPIAAQLEKIDTKPIKEIATIQNDIDSIEEKYYKILNIDNFLNKTDVLLNDNKTKKTVTDLQDEYTSQNIEQLIADISNANLKNNYQAKLASVKDILTDKTAPLLNVGDNQVINADFQIEITDDNNYQALLNGQDISDFTITENGEYELKATDAALNETTVHFKVEKPIEEPEEVIYSEISENPTEEVEEVTTRYPMNNWYLTQDYSGKEGHMGIDMGSSNKKEEIYPIADGTVVYVGQDNNGANLVQIKHDINGEEVFSTYAHMREVFLNPEQQVTKNDLLGIMGATGNATGPHLHLETATCAWEYNCSYSNYKNSLVSPWTYLPQS